MNEENPSPLPSPVFSRPSPALETAPSGSGNLQGTMSALQAMKSQIARVFLGQERVLNEVLASFLAGGHVLLEGKPGLGKTHLVLALARTFGGTFRRIQFTPDLLPSDVTGHTLYDMKSQSFQTRHGPVFTNLLLADEINRAPAKTQAALLEVMQEEQVTIDGTTHKLQPPFMTLATQNPIEHEGTYPLPEAQLDRFMMKILIDYPESHHEAAIVSAATGGEGSLSIAQVEPVCSQADILAARQDCAAILATPEVVDYAVRIVRATRQSQGISLGAGTRGAISLVRAAKANALLQNRSFITPDDVKSAVLPVLRHRVILAPELTISGQHIDDVLRALANTVEAPRQ